MMDGIVSLTLALLSGAFLSSVVFASIARSLGFVPSETIKPAYRTAADFRIQVNPPTVSTGLKTLQNGNLMVYYSYDPTTSLYYSILPKGDSPGQAKLQHQLKTRSEFKTRHEFPTQNTSGRKRYPGPANDLLRRIDLDEKDGSSFSGGFADAGDE